MICVPVMMDWTVNVCGCASVVQIKCLWPAGELSLSFISELIMAMQAR